MTKVVIGIQARSGSKRLPGKSLKIMDDKRMIEHVISAAGRAAGYVNRTKTKTPISSSVVLLIPTGDPIKTHFPDEIVLEGSEKDVFSRYLEALKKFEADYIVRITGDCPLIIPTIISKHVFCALSGEFDYLSNTIPEVRTYVDGYDCVVHSFIDSLKASGEIRITKMEMSRFWINIDEAALFMLSHYLTPTDAVMIPKMKAARVFDLAKRVANYLGITHFVYKETGIRKGEKIHECLESNHDYCLRSDTSEQYTERELDELIGRSLV